MQCDMFHLVTLFLFQTMVQIIKLLLCFGKNTFDVHVLGKLRSFKWHYTRKYTIPASWQDAAKSFFTSQTVKQEISYLQCIPVLLLYLQKPAAASYYVADQSIPNITPCFIMTQFNP